MRLAPLFTSTALAALAFTGAAVAHELDHAPPFIPAGSSPPSPVVNSGGPGAKWELVRTLYTGNPHSDLDVFRHKGELYLSAGSLGTGPNAAGQTIAQLTSDGQVSPRLVSSHASGTCLSAGTSATALQHDVEATPKAGTLLTDDASVAEGGDAQLLVDSSDGAGRCHDNGTFGQNGAPAGGLELIDVTDPAKPVELALIRSTGNAHTVNVDPKRPHIAFIVTQDGTSVGPDGKRGNETSGNGLDGFEIVDMSSCMDFPAGTSVAAKRAACRPEVFRYRYESAAVSKSHTFPTMQSCHELEVYADDRITCASITATAIFDMSGAFDAEGRPKGEPLPCKTVSSSSLASGTGAPIQDCATGLNVSSWLKLGAPAIEGIEWVGSVPHMGFGTTTDIANSKYDATQDLVAAHESEYTQSRRYVITSDERGGGVVPPESACGPGSNDALKKTNGGLHFFKADAFSRTPATTFEEASKAWARTPAGEKAVYRATPRVPRPTICTAHVFQQIPGQNRIFMGYYSQGTQVVDFTENADGTISFKEAGWFIPENANTWTSHVFKVQENADGTWTYWGATGDGILPGTGRNAIDIYKVTLPAPPKPRRATDGTATPNGTPDGKPDATPGPATPPAASRAPERCTATTALRRATATPRGRALALGYDRAGTGAVRIDVFRETGTGHRKVADLGTRDERSTWRPTGRLRSGTYTVRFRTATADGRTEVRRVAARVRAGRFAPAGGAFERTAPCGLLQATRVLRPVVASGRALGVQVVASKATPVTVEVRRGSRVVRRAGTTVATGKATTMRVALPRSLRPGALTVVVRAGAERAVLAARRG